MQELVPNYCVRCPLWDDGAVRRACSEVHLWALVDNDQSGVVLLADHLRRARRHLREGDDASSAVGAAVALRDAFEALDQLEEHRQALHPVVEATMRRLLKHYLNQPASLFQLIEPTGDRRVTDEEWSSYVSRLSDRAKMESGTLHESQGAALLDVRGTVVHLSREAATAPDTSPDFGALVTKEALPQLLTVPQAGQHQIVVRLSPPEPGATSLGEAPNWLLRMLDPRPDGHMVAELLEMLDRGPDAPMRTESFLTTQRYRSAWPLSVVQRAFDAIAKEGRGRMRDVAGVGSVLVLD